MVAQCETYIFEILTSHYFQAKKITKDFLTLFTQVCGGKYKCSGFFSGENENKSDGGDSSLDPTIMIGVNALVIIILIGCCVMFYLKTKPTEHKQLDDVHMEMVAPAATVKRTARTTYSN